MSDEKSEIQAGAPCTCRSPKNPTECDVCHAPVCKKCVLVLGSEAFVYQAEVSEILKHRHYCSTCYDTHVAPELAIYEEIVERAKNVTFLTEAYKGHLPVLKRAKKKVEIASCIDRDQAIMRLAFLAARDGYNALIHSEVISKKVRNHAYQKSDWSGHGMPVMLDEKKFIMQEEREEAYRRGH